MKVNKMVSVHTQIPYSYYSLPFCRPDEIIDARENIGEMLLGDKIENSPYILRVQWEIPCRVVCVKNYNPNEIKAFAEKISQEYRIHWILDNLPAATRRTLTDNTGAMKDIYEAGFSLGDIGIIEEEKKDVYLLNNHINMRILYHENREKYDGIRIVGFEVAAESIDHDVSSFNAEDPDAVPATCGSRGVDPVTTVPLVLSTEKEDPTTVVWTYSVDWVESPIPWSSRWDTYLMMTDDQIHWYSILNSFMIVIFLSGIVGMIMMRTLRRDIISYREANSAAEENPDETGWKLVHGDVFRPPDNKILLSVSVGTGVQTLAMAAVVMVFAVLGFLSPSNRGGLMTTMVVILELMGLLAGYFSARTYKKFGGKNWKKVMFLTPLLYPGIAFGIFFFLNSLLAGEKSSGAVPWYALLELAGLWFGISTPLCLIGSYFAYKKPVADPPVRVHQIPRQIPEQVWYLKPSFSVLIGGILPFGAIFIELFFILTSIWLHQFYYLFGFLFIVFIILGITCAEITIVLCYLQLCSEDYRWWWRAFLTSGASAFYMFLYSIFYFLTKLSITSLASTLLYFGYTLIMATQFFLMTGTIGFYACYAFVYLIYSSIKVA
eukprot:TRINITY_DN5992_c0_g1_i1.p1 TRINITY_DN5992_c0_g1~~TRINITY_DN5992_c0_g1_i1.p1  ORF type:complete len:647 (-),score=75.10 TRINITY_DN5992_c0_g1_i1:89-1903(-)